MPNKRSDGATSICLFAMVFILFLPTTAFADGWWNPFSKSSASRDSSPLYPSSSSTSGSKSSWMPTFKAPKMPWSKSGPKVGSYSRNKGSTWDKMSRTSKRWWNKTAEMLDPYPEPAPEKYTPEKPKTNWFTGWFSKKDDGKKIETVPEWLGQPSPKY